MALALTAALTLPFTPHTATGLEQWQEDWTAAAMENLTVDLMGDWRSMHDRHPWFFDPQPEEVRHVSFPGDVATPPPGNTGIGSNVEQWRGLVAAFFPLEEVDRALRIMACESGGNPNAYNPSGASGLMQVLASWADNFGYVPADLFNPAINLQVARYLWDDGGWGHWMCRG